MPEIFLGLQHSHTSRDCHVFDSWIFYAKEPQEFGRTSVKVLSKAAGPIVLIDDAHTFGGAQIALAWAIRAVVENTNHSVVCVCTEKTKQAILRIVGAQEKVGFLICQPALPFSMLSFLFRLPRFFSLLIPLRRRGVAAWWLNLSGLESCVAALVVLKSMSVKHSAWLHCTESISILFPGRTAFRRIINGVRDMLAEHLMFRLHPVLVTPSEGASEVLRRRTRTSSLVPHLYPTVGTPEAPRGESQAAAVEGQPRRIDLWMIGRIQFGQKNNKAAVHTLQVLRDRGTPARLNVVGDGPDKEELLNLCKRFISGEEVTFNGWSANPWSSVNEDDLVLIPSLWEGMPLIAIEAMLRGIRIVTTPLTMFYEGVPHEFVAEGFSGELLANQVEQVLRMSRADVLARYAQCIHRFSAQSFIDSFAQISNGNQTVAVDCASPAEV